MMEEETERETEFLREQRKSEGEVKKGDQERRTELKWCGPGNRNIGGKHDRQAGAIASNRGGKRGEGVGGAVLGGRGCGCERSE